MNDNNYPMGPTQMGPLATGISPGHQNQHLRFGFPSPYPRPRSSATKPNPGNTFEEQTTRYYQSYSHSQNSPLFKFANYSPNDSYSRETFTRRSDVNNSKSSFLDNSSFLSNRVQNSPSDYPPNYSYSNASDFSGIRPYDRTCDDMAYSNSFNQANFSKWKPGLDDSIFDTDSSYTTCSDTSFTNNSFKQNTNYTRGTLSNKNFGMKRRDAYSRFSGNSNPKFGEQETGNQQQENKHFKKPIKRKAPASQGNLRCELCGIDFTSQVPLAMHIQGAKHAKKLKAVETLRLLQSQGHAEPTDTETKIFRCDTCDMSLNGALQLQTHFEGNKHKQKIQQLQNPEASTETENAKQGPSEIIKQTEITKVSSSPPSDNAPPVNKMVKLACEICSITVNSGAQLQQHLESKKHKAKLEGKPLQKNWTKFKKDKKNGENNIENPQESEVVVSIPDIKSSFVKAETATN